MTSRELRNQRREAERKARKLAYRESRNAASAAVAALPGSFTTNRDLFDEFSAEEQAEMAAIRARIHARTGSSDIPQSSAAPESRADPLVRMPVPRPAIASSKRSGPTGPRSPEGKAISSGNSLKHGLASGRVIIPGEDPADFEALLADLLKEHAPANETESLLVQQMAQSWWLMQRAIRIQNEAFTESRVDTHKLALFLRYQTTYERAFYRALNTLLKLNRARGVRSTSASAPQQAESSEFVSQSRPQAQHDNGFVSQKRPHASEPDQFVSQTVTGNIGAPASDKFKFGSVPTLHEEAA